MKNDYECPKCHNIFPSENKVLNDFRCTEENPLPLDQSRKMKINEKNNIKQINNNNLINKKENSQKMEIKNQIFQFNSEFQNEDDFPNYFSCDLCGIVLPESVKSDHLFCHNLEQKEKESINKNLLKLQGINIQEQKKIEEQIKMEKQNKIKQQKKMEENIKKKNSEKQQKRLKMIQEQRKIEEQIKKQNEMRRQRERTREREIVFQSPSIRINILNGNEFLQPVHPNYNHPTDKNILNELPENRLDDVTKLDNEKKNCLICLEDFKNGDKTLVLPCIHFFHTLCIKNWLKTQNTCPICKYKLIRSNVH